LNADQRRALAAANVKKFVDECGRKSQKGVEPNDRHHDRKVERSIKQMKPEALDQLLRDDEE